MPCGAADKAIKRYFAKEAAEFDRRMADVFAGMC